MSFIEAFGYYLPSRIVPNAELALLLECQEDWILSASGIEERRYAAESESVADLGAAAARDCLDRASVNSGEIGMLMVSSGSSERRFPGPAASIAHQLGLEDAPALDIPLASAGSIFALSLASRLTLHYGRILVVAAEKMSSVIHAATVDRNTAILFGDGAAAALLNRSAGFLEVIDSVLHSDGEYSEDLHLEFDQPLAMNGRSVILQAARKLPAGIREVLDRNAVSPQSVTAFLSHQANRNLLDRVAGALEVEPERFFTNIRRYGNTSSASMLIAAKEWRHSYAPNPGDFVCFAGFGAGFHWGALLARVAA